MEVTISKSNYTFPNVSTWLHRLEHSHESAKFSMWDFVMTLRCGLDQFGRTDARKDELYELASQQIGLSVGTLKTYASAVSSPSAAIAIDKGLSFQHARAVLGLDAEVADDMLERAVAGGWGAEKLGHEVWAKKNGLPSPTSQRTLTSNTPPPVAPEVDDVPFDHARHDDDGPVVESLWPDERIDDMVQQVAQMTVDCYGNPWEVVSAEDAKKLLRTMRDEEQLFA